MGIFFGVQAVSLRDRLHWYYIRITDESPGSPVLFYPVNIISDYCVIIAKNLCDSGGSRQTKQLPQIQRFSRIVASSVQMRLSVLLLEAEAAYEKKGRWSKPLELHSAPRHAEAPFPPPAQTGEMKYDLKDLI